MPDNQFPLSSSPVPKPPLVLCPWRHFLLSAFRPPHSRGLPSTSVAAGSWCLCWSSFTFLSPRKLKCLRARLLSCLLHLSKGPLRLAAINLKWLLQPDPGPWMPHLVTDSCVSNQRPLDSRLSTQRPGELLPWNTQWPRGTCLRSDATFSLTHTSEVFLFLQRPSSPPYPPLARLGWGCKKCRTKSNSSQLAIRKPEISTYQGSLELASSLALPPGLTKTLLSPPPTPAVYQLGCLPKFCSHKAEWEGRLVFK